MTLAQTPTTASEAIAGHLGTVRSRIEAACERVDRDPSEVTLVAITKTLPIPRIREAYAAGLRDFGENRLEEAREKLPNLREQLTEARWHMVGHVQSRKAASIPALFDYLHSLDSLKLARRLGRFAGERGLILPVLAQCNVSGEASKSGFPASGWRENGKTFEQLLASLREIITIPGLKLSGLMTMAPILANPEATRPYFACLAALRTAVQDAISSPPPCIEHGYDERL